MDGSIGMEFDLAHAIEILERTPGTLRSLLDGLSEPWLVNNEGPDTFSPRDVLGHLIYGEEVDWVPRINIIIFEGGESRPFTPFDRFAFRGWIEEKSLGELLETFERLRRENLRVVRDLDLGPDQLALTGTHPELGRVTLQQLIATWAVHDLNHIAQIVRVMAKQYRERVGPWREYSPLLRR